MPIRFRIRTIMIVIAVSAMMMGLLRLAPPLFFLLLILVVSSFSISASCSGNTLPFCGV